MTDCLRFHWYEVKNIGMWVQRGNLGLGIMLKQWVGEAKRGLMCDVTEKNTNEHQWTTEVPIGETMPTMGTKLSKP